ncbi:energy-coupling factor transporter transmembrane protein EcfT [Vagococcus sp. PNs007]|uniref:Energy-coupling factor transporter transmembrane protein EcfT n=1 Tax=Vagococcus proximus TaxID=2991417 RepID=A0ABT5WZD2_9ENTE|nr:energy-coupling factor transporter transmembrane component T [Vagococcus proximus]MDF0479116.1 energy-coupling factor transporter transmembrane protein EcfT [Vagococcus proximus]
MRSEHQKDDTVLSFYHPVLLLSYYCLVLLTTMFTDNPLVRGISFLGAMCACWLVLEKDLFYKNIKLGSLMVFVATLSNFLFVHRGATILYILKFRLFEKNYRYLFTLESIVYGASFGLMMFAMLLWFQSLNKVLTTEKVTFLFGRLLPKLALVLSMVMRFLPMYQSQMRTIQQAQEGLGQSFSGSVKEKATKGTLVLGSLFSWALENAIETSDSMNARGFGMKGRTNFSIFKWRGRDMSFLFILFLAGCGISYSMLHQSFKFTYYSHLRFLQENQLTSMVGYGFISITFLMPILVEVKEWLRWKFLQSKI